MPPPSGDISTPWLPHVLPPSLWSAWPLGGGTPPGPLSSPPTLHKSHCGQLAPIKPPTYTSSNRLAVLLSSLPTHLESSPTASAISSGSDTTVANSCCYIWFSAQGNGRPSAVAGRLHWSRTIPYLPQIRAVESCCRVADPLPVFSSPKHSAGWYYPCVKCRLEPVLFHFAFEVLRKPFFLICVC